jgi:hypothetical protein
MGNMLMPGYRHRAWEYLPCDFAQDPVREGVPGDRSAE